jgi:hypothetical protein
MDGRENSKGVAELGDEPLATGTEPPCNMLGNHPAIQQRHSKIPIHALRWRGPLG